MKKCLILDSIYNSQNDRIWTVNREEPNRRGGEKQQRKFAGKVMVWLAVCSEGVKPLVLCEHGTLHHHQGSTVCRSTTQKQSIWKQLDVPTRQPNTTYSARNARVVLPRFLDKNTWPANSPDLNRVDDCIWDEFAQAINWDQGHRKVN